MPDNLTDYSFQNTVIASANVPPKRQPTSIFNRDQIQMGEKVYQKTAFISPLVFE
jgi:hypothetical protein